MCSLLAARGSWEEGRGRERRRILADGTRVEVGDRDTLGENLSEGLLRKGEGPQRRRAERNGEGAERASLEDLSALSWAPCPGQTVGKRAASSPSRPVRPAVGPLS